MTLQMEAKVHIVGAVQEKKYKEVNMEIICM